MRWMNLAWMLLLCGGCASFEYDIVQPPELARHIGSGDDTLLTAGSLDYQMRVVENRLVIQIHNPTLERVELVGIKSSEVDPNGKIHQLKAKIIEPGSITKLILPPLREQYEGSGPPLGTGGAFSDTDQPGQLSGSAVGLGGEGYDPSHEGDDDQDRSGSWVWDGETDVQLTLVFRQGNQIFQQAFVFHRKKV